MKIRTFAVLATVALLSACSSQATVSYEMTMNTPVPEEREELTKASLRVAERRLESMSETPLDQTVDMDSDPPTMTLTVSSEDIASFLTEELTAPFTMEVMKEVAEGEGDITVNGMGSFKKTGINQAHLVWVNAKEDGTEGKGMVRLVFSDEGRALMTQLFKESKGKNIGLFVRDRLVSKLMVETDLMQDEIIIRDIPSLALAQVFADDVNVGLHVLFTLPSDTPSETPSSTASSVTPSEE